MTLRKLEKVEEKQDNLNLKINTKKQLSRYPNLNIEICRKENQNNPDLAKKFRTDGSRSATLNNGKRGKRSGTLAGIKTFDIIF